MAKEKPGEFPYKRGIYEEMYKKRLWTMRQYAGFTSAVDTNERFKYLLKNGVTGLSVAFDLPTQIGYDSDDLMADGEVGKVGVPISSVHDMKNLFHQIPLADVSVSMTINATAPIILANYIVAAEHQNIAIKNLRGTIQNDILKEYIARGTFIFPPNPSLRLVTDVIEFCSNHIPKWNTISISGYHIREAGSTAAQELAFTFANAIAYVERAQKRGLKLEKFGKRLSFFFNAHNDFLIEISKFRAARKLWATIMKNRFGVTNEKVLQCRFHTQTGGSTLTAQQIDNNVVRTTIQAMSAVLGGTQSLHTNSKDEAISLPTDESVNLALRTQQIIAHESGIPNHPDPFGGSYVVEQMTEELVSESLEIIEKIDSLGGTVQAIEKGWIQNEISKSAYDYQLKVDSGETTIVGVNKFDEDEDVVSNLHEISTLSVNTQIKNVKKLKQSRDNLRVKKTLEILTEKCRGNENLLPHIIDCVKSECTIGEITQVMKNVFGEHQFSG
jgi:methylmalonyl-CoA mutase N-terminal domain/subunit